MQKGQEIDMGAIMLDNKKQKLEKQFDVTKIQERIERLEEENKLLDEDTKNIRQDWIEKQEQYEVDIQVRKRDRERLKDEKAKIDYDFEMQIKRKKELQDNYEDKMTRREQEFRGEKSDLDDKRKMLEAKIDNIDSFIKQQDMLVARKNELKDNLENEKRSKEQELEEKNIEKIEATDKLKKEMLHKIQETKTSLLALKKEQLQTTIRLTVLQNHQLTTELEYQSKQTEKLLFKNQKLQEEISILKRDVEIHKQVEQELAKRSHFCQKLIKKLKIRIDELNDENLEIEEQKQQSLIQQEQIPQDDAEKDRIIEKLDTHIQNVERRISQTQNDCEIMKSENAYLQKKSDGSEIKYTNLAIIVQELIVSEKEKMRQDSQQDPEDEDLTYGFDLNEIKNRNVDMWSGPQKIALLSIIMNQIIPQIQSRDFADQLADQKALNINLIDEKQQKGDISLPRIGTDHSQRSDINQSQTNNRFQEVPIDISTKIVKSNLRQWNKVSQTMPSTNSKSLVRRFKVQ